MAFFARRRLNKHAVIMRIENEICISAGKHSDLTDSPEKIL